MSILLKMSCKFALMYVWRDLLDVPLLKERTCLFHASKGILLHLLIDEPLLSSNNSQEHKVGAPSLLSQPMAVHFHPKESALCVT